MTQSATTPNALAAKAGIELQAAPEHCPGCYSMHFYCKYNNPAHPRPWEMYMEEADQVETRTAAIRQMRGAGWIYHRDGTATCPRCAKALREAKKGTTPC